MSFLGEYMKHPLSLTSFVALGVVAMVSAVFLDSSSAHAAFMDLSMQAGANSAKGTGQATDLFGQAGIFQNITNTLLFVVGSISVIMLVIGGLRYVISGGESSAVQAAKNTILYAIVGVIVSMLAYAAVAFVIGSFADSTGGVGGTDV